MFRSKCTKLCPSCGALLPPLRDYTGAAASNGGDLSTAISPSRVVVMHKTSRLEFERRKQKHLSEKQLHAELSRRLGAGYDILQQRHSTQKRNLEEIDRFLSSQGISVRWRDRESYSTSDVEWADTIVAAGGDGNFLFASSKILSSDKIVVGLNTDPSWSEGYLCLSPSNSSSLTDVLREAFSGRYPLIRRWRIRVKLNDELLPVRALNEVFVGERNISHSAYYELSCDGLQPEKQKSSGLLVYTGTGSTSWAYNVNKLMPFQVRRLFEMTKEREKDTSAMEDMVRQVTEQFNENNRFGGDEEKMAYVVREPIVRGIFAANNTHGFAKRVVVRSLSWNATLVVDGLSPGYDFKRGAVATCELHPQDGLTTLDPRYTTSLL